VVDTWRSYKKHLFARVTHALIPESVKLHASSLTNRASLLQPYRLLLLLLPHALSRQQISLSDRLWDSVAAAALDDLHC